MSKIKVIRPQKGPQEKFLSTTADIAIYGGAAGGGKSYGLLIEPLRYKDNKRFGAVIFRHEYKQIFNQGGLWDTSNDVYGDIKGADGRYSAGMWRFKNGMTIAFDYINRDDDLQKWQGSQITMIGFDELTHFSEKQFFYMLSRNRSVCGVKPYMRATCNPDADSWVANFISWWIDQDTGYPIKERSGKKRWFVRINENVMWAATREEAVQIALDANIGREEAETMADYFGTSINESPTIVLEAGKDIEGAQGIALAIKNGKAEKPTAGANVIGLSLFTNDEKVKAGDDVDIQVKDIGKWIAGEAVAVGDELTTNAEGKAVKAAAGNFITAVALSAATEAGSVVKVQLIKAGYKPKE